MSATASFCTELYHLIPQSEGSLPCPKCGLRWTAAVESDPFRPYPEKPIATVSRPTAAPLGDSVHGDATPGAPLCENPQADTEYDCPKCGTRESLATRATTGERHCVRKGCDYRAPRPTAAGLRDAVQEFLDAEDAVDREAERAGGTPGWSSAPCVRRIEAVKQLRDLLSAAPPPVERERPSKHEYEAVVGALRSARTGQAPIPTLASNLLHALATIRAAAPPEQERETPPGGVLASLLRYDLPSAPARPHPRSTDAPQRKGEP